MSATISKADLLEGKPKQVDLNGTPVCVVRVQGEIFAVADTCSHSDASLSEGDITDFKIECWLHGAEFDLRTGEALTPPAVQAIETFTVTDNGETVEIG
ncbi:MAG: non-heme iron oxygenase ferredoxin subunit [Actinomycetes bacterium]|jgi:3-phenylpropionate/trans-cinnamate dioxygenase ferredoxin subunit